MRTVLPRPSPTDRPMLLGAGHSATQLGVIATTYRHHLRLPSHAQQRRPDTGLGALTGAAEPRCLDSCRISCNLTEPPWAVCEASCSHMGVRAAERGGGLRLAPSCQPLAADQQVQQPPCVSMLCLYRRWSSDSVTTRTMSFTSVLNLHERHLAGHTGHKFKGIFMDCCIHMLLTAADTIQEPASGCC